MVRAACHSAKAIVTGFPPNDVCNKKNQITTYLRILYNIIEKDEEGLSSITIPDKDHFVLLKTISGIKQQVHKMHTYGNDDMKDMRNEFAGYMAGLVDACDELHKDEEQ